MSETNNRTVESYNAHIQEYIDGTPHEVSGVVKDWLDGSLADVPKDARILEFGSAFGRDAEYHILQGLVMQLSVRMQRQHLLICCNKKVLTQKF